MKVHPPLAACLRFSARTLGMALGFVMIFGMAIRFLKDQPFVGFPVLFQLTLLFAGLAVGVGLLVYLVLRFWTWSVDPPGISGRTYWGRRARIAWADVEKVGLVTAEGIPALVVTSSRSSREVYAYILGVDVPAIYRHLARDAGPDHVLTRCFGPEEA